MTMTESVNKIDWMNKRFPNWYRWATAKPWTWAKICALYTKVENKQTHNSRVTQGAVAHIAEAATW